MHWAFWVLTAFGILGVINLLLLVGMVFLEKKKPQTIIAWLSILTFFPGIGFIFYILLGSGLSYRTRRMLKKKAISEKDVLNNIRGLQTFSEVSGTKISVKTPSLSNFASTWAAILASTTMSNISA